MGQYFTVPVCCIVDVWDPNYMLIPPFPPNDCDNLKYPHKFLEQTLGAEIVETNQAKMFSGSIFSVHLV